MEKAYEYAEKAHQGMTRKSGEPFIQHPLHVAYYLSEVQLDAVSLAAGLLHDVPEDCGVPLSEIEKEFGPEVLPPG